jgi:hypothetical protein
MLLVMMMDAHEGRNFATANITGAYLTAKMDDFVVVKFTGKLVDIMFTMNRKYTDFVAFEGNLYRFFVMLF